MRQLFSSFRTNLITGALALAPLAAVMWVVAWLWRLLAGVRNILPYSWDPREVLAIEDPVALSLINGFTTLVLILVVIVLIAVVGMVSRHMLGRRLLQTVQRLVNRIPVLRTVYSTLEQLLDTFGGSQGRNFSRVVMIEYPRKGIYALALVTGERPQLLAGPSTSIGPFLNVYVPTTPNPTSGFFLTLPASEAVEVQISVEEALKQIISMGIVH